MTGRSEAGAEPILAVDLGGTKIAVAEVRGATVARRSQVATPRTGRGADLVEAIAAEVLSRRNVGSVGVATTGLVRDGRLTALNPGTLPVEDGFPLADALGARLGRRPLLLNDAQAAAWGEARFGAGRPFGSFLFMTVSTGVGGGVVAAGRLLVGREGLAGHVGHMTADPQGPSCGCGRRGCLEAVASGSALARLGSAALGRAVAAPELFRLATEGDRAAAGLVGAAAAAVARTFLDLVAALDLEALVLGGGAGLAPGFRAAVAERIAAAPAPFRRPALAAEAGADAGLIGIAALAQAAEVEGTPRLRL